MNPSANPTTGTKLAKHDAGVLGSLGDAVDVLRGSAMDYVKWGAGASLAITGSDFLLSRVLVSKGKPLISPNWGPFAVAGLSVLGGEVARRQFGWSKLGVGMIAGGVGVGVAAGVKWLFSRMTRSQTAAASAAEASGQGAQAMEGFGFGRAFAGGGNGFRGFGRLPAQSLYGAGADLSAASVFGGATVAIEENGAVSGAAVRIEEDASGFAGVIQ